MYGWVVTYLKRQLPLHCVYVVGVLWWELIRQHGNRLDIADDGWSTWNQETVNLELYIHLKRWGWATIHQQTQPTTINSFIPMCPKRTVWLIPSHTVTASHASSFPFPHSLDCRCDNNNKQPKQQQQEHFQKAAIPHCPRMKRTHTLTHRKPVNNKWPPCVARSLKCVRTLTIKHTHTRGTTRFIALIHVCVCLCVKCWSCESSRRSEPRIGPRRKRNDEGPSSHRVRPGPDDDVRHFVVRRPSLYIFLRASLCLAAVSCASSRKNGCEDKWKIYVYCWALVSRRGIVCVSRVCVRAHIRSSSSYSYTRRAMGRAFVKAGPPGRYYHHSTTIRVRKVLRFRLRIIDFQLID